MPSKGAATMRWTCGSSTTVQDVLQGQGQASGTQRMVAAASDHQRVAQAGKRLRQALSHCLTVPRSSTFRSGPATWPTSNKKQESSGVAGRFAAIKQMPTMWLSRSCSCNAVKSLTFQSSASRGHEGSDVDGTSSVELPQE